MRGFQRDACCGVAQLVVVHLLELLNVLSLVRGSRSAISKTMRLLYDTTVAVMGRAASQTRPWSHYYFDFDVHAPKPFSFLHPHSSALQAAPPVHY
eukprot:scaffold87525_cov30-Tisochrysis_lutea.AAC.2